jgi:hypothetical protein
VDSALGFLPLGPGNLWHYKRYDTQNGTLLSYRYLDKWITADTLVNNHHFWILNTGLWPNANMSREMIRVDSASSIVYHIYPQGFYESGGDSLRAGVGPGYHSTCLFFGDLTVLGIVTKAKSFGHQGDGGDYYTYAYGFGIVQNSAVWPTGGPMVGYADSLCYARINGNEYGTYLSVSNPNEVFPEQFSLEQNYPNPFNPLTTIRYGLPNRWHVSLAVFNTLGQQVALLENGEREAGYHEVRFDGSGLSSGVYFYRMHAGTYVETKRLLLVK